MRMGKKRFINSFRPKRGNGTDAGSVARRDHPREDPREHKHGGGDERDVEADLRLGEQRGLPASPRAREDPRGELQGADARADAEIASDGSEEHGLLEDLPDYHGRPRAERLP